MKRSPAPHAALNELVQAGYALRPDQERRFTLLLALFLAKNERLNLSAIRDEAGVVSRHFLDSLSALHTKRFSRATNVLDLGTGGGFPGLPLAILSPETSFVLLDATRKKIDAVEGFVQTLGLSNVKTVWGRAEEAATKKKLGKKFDGVIARAVTYLPDLLLLADPYLAPGGCAIAYKLSDARERADGLSQAKKLGMRLSEELPYFLPGSPQRRTLLVFSKTAKQQREKAGKKQKVEKKREK